MRAIWKFDFEIADIVTISIPAGAQLIRVEEQGGVPCVWAIVDTDAQYTDRTIRIHGTGHEIDHDLPYFGTFFSGPFVWHVFA